jgi:predicted transposase YbfD/YdcC
MDISTPKPEYVTISQTVDKSLADRLASELAAVPDHRGRRGRRFELGQMLTCAALAKLAGARTAADLSRWMADRADALAALGLPVFSYKTALRLTRETDAAVLDRVLCRLAGLAAAARAAPGAAMAVAVDGKELTGSIRRDAPAVRLVSVWDHATGATLGQAQVASKGGEQAALPGLLAQVAAVLAETPGGPGRHVVVTMDANFCGDPALRAVASAGADWIVTVKGNRRKTVDHLAQTDWADRPAGVDRADKGHGRWAAIQARAAEPGDVWGCPMPGVRSAIRISRTTERPNPANGKKAKDPNRPETGPSARTTRRGGWYKTVSETVYVASSLPATPATAEALYSRHRAHWGIEAHHWRRDVDFAEDASQLRSGTAPRFMAAFNNFAVSVIRLAEGIDANVKAETNKAAASLPHNVGLLRAVL